MGDINTIFKLSCNPALVTEITKARCKLQGMGYIVAVVRVSAHKGDYANYVADAGAKAGSKMKEVVEPKLDRRCELVKVLCRDTSPETVQGPRECLPYISTCLGGREGGTDCAGNTASQPLVCPLHCAYSHLYSPQKCVFL